MTGNEPYYPTPVYYQIEYPITDFIPGITIRQEAILRFMVANIGHFSVQSAHLLAEEAELWADAYIKIISK